MSHEPTAGLSAPVIRAEVSPSLTREGLAKLDALLGSFYERYPKCSGDVPRFEFLLDEMFEVFLSLNVETTASGESIDCFPLHDNFDTGNASSGPFPPFVAGVQEAFRDLDAYRGYVGPRPIEGLPEAVKDWLIHHGFITAQRSSELVVAVGAGTVHLYDVLCRAMIQRPGDTVIIPEVTYGFFIPQVERNGGRTHILHATHSAKIDAGTVAVTVDAINNASAHNWRKTARQRLEVYTVEIEGFFRDAICNPGNGLLEDLIYELSACDSPLEIQSKLEHFILSEICRGDAALSSRVSAAPQTRMLFPPRVVAYLHINPNLYGKSYDPEESSLITKSLAARSVTVIEDFAYHSLGLPIANFKSCLLFGANVFTLLGVSKPLAIANCRLGILLGERDAMHGLYRIVENSVGFVSTLLQRGLLKAFSEPEALDEYLAANWSEPGGYRRKKNLMLACMEGGSSPNLDPDSRDISRQNILDGVSEFFAWKRAQGVELYDADYQFADGQCAATPPDYQRRVADDFVKEGLSRWLEVCTSPDCGFFVIVDCRRLLERCHLRKPRLTCGFDVFALFAVLFGVRTIPEECMGDLDFTDSHRLRFSYSVPTETIIRACVTLYLGMTHLESRFADGVS
ncbi:MAG: aminotransferase class I/II-fold pyridoxal phosphate-dependent enzyme [Pyrinomonadaceae bacterium]